MPPDSRCSAGTTRAWTSASAAISLRTRSSIGDYVLSGGEPAAIVVVDAVARHVPGVLAGAVVERGVARARAVGVPAVHAPCRLSWLAGSCYTFERPPRRDSRAGAAASRFCVRRYDGPTCWHAPISRLPRNGGWPRRSLPRGTTDLRGAARQKQPGHSTGSRPPGRGCEEETTHGPEQLHRAPTQPEHPRVPHRRHRPRQLQGSGGRSRADPDVRGRRHSPAPRRLEHELHRATHDARRRCRADLPALFTARRKGRYRPARQSASLAPATICAA